MDKQVEIGICERPHGIKGGFVFKLHHPEDSFLKSGMEIFLIPISSKSSLPKQGKTFEITNISFGNKVICYLTGMLDRSQVEEILPFSINISREVFPQVQENEYYVADLIGMKVINFITKSEIGKIHSYYDNGSQTIFVIAMDDSGLKVDIPFTHSFFPVVDIEDGKVEVNLPIMVDDGTR
ncbi:MAG: 16S rRNA processing protein RimM [Bdellovibrionales bacterium RIFOXYB1_FULL_37_110]|nr:MAG: 16S rRNA processing protein RimM [Bdellovibrionales bacterium RIFOXYA1_FULL_38_20]OFZ51483.1 MAG: 16S rRNA processing protein RimM [Bdellovibrionales bacterium RIFOXYC1_FULL_37_79]OFZ57911.1 MAG: 16S rRNA processing protein RimM [Bdellovibrionales bacterium RIFOXYB1_FULL_37_110]OFZ63637.1 MAG: 16S rRNA processing protein RimM [Bdellovibrionales bacterium RIFOXYD1_FULL_36_51]